MKRGNGLSPTGRGNSEEKKNTSVQIPALSLSCCVTSDRLLSVSELRFSYYMMDVIQQPYKSPNLNEVPLMVMFV